MTRNCLPLILNGSKLWEWPDRKITHFFDCRNGGTKCCCTGSEEPTTLLLLYGEWWQPTITSFTEASVSSWARVCRYQASCLLMSPGLILVKLELSNSTATESTISA